MYFPEKVQFEFFRLRTKNFYSFAGGDRVCELRMTRLSTRFYDGSFCISLPLTVAVARLVDQSSLCFHLFLPQFVNSEITFKIFIEPLCSLSSRIASFMKYFFKKMLIICLTCQVIFSCAPPI